MPAAFETSCIWLPRFFRFLPTLEQQLDVYRLPRYDRLVRAWPDRFLSPAESPQAYRTVARFNLKLEVRTTS